MSVLLDTSFLLAFYNRRDAHAPRALELMDEISQGVHGGAHFTDYVADELLTLVWARTKDARLLETLYKDLISGEGPSPGSLVFVGQERFEMASTLHRRHHARLSFTDCTTLAVARDLGIEKVASFDEGFEGHVDRVH